uniref:Peptidase C19 ubiquitin carboxyl-terminal hydrolase domain-containing protein n=1 Tax=Ditylenchus dipsaci TaxID=166011 RepID=A0A915DFC5_9BILA
MPTGVRSAAHQKEMIGIRTITKPSDLRFKNVKRIDSAQENIWYSLYGIVSHSGDLSSGHYIAYVRARPQMEKKVKHLFDRCFFDEPNEISKIVSEKCKGLSLEEGEKAEDVHLQDPGDIFDSIASKSKCAVMDFDFIANVLARIDQNQQVVAQNDNIISMVKSSKRNDMAIHHAYGGNGAKCKARLHTLVASNLFLKFIPHHSIYPHNHKIDPMAVTVSKIKANIKQGSVETREKPQQLLNHELQSTPISVASSLPKSAVRKQRLVEWRIAGGGFQFLAMIEGPGNDRGQIGMACMDLRHSELNLCQFVDTSSYILLKVCLSIHEPVEVILPEVSAETSGAVSGEVLVDFIRNLCGEKSVTSIQHRFFNDSGGIDLVKQLGVQESSNDALGVEHPTVVRLLADLKRIQRTHDFDYEQYLAGIAAPRKRRIYREADARILGKVERYRQTNLIEYLRGLAHNFVMDQ